MKYKVAFEEFESINALRHTINTRPLNKAFEGESELSSQTGDSSFTGTKNYKEAEDLLVMGWDKHVERFKGGFKGAVTNAPTEKRRPSTGIVGYAPNVPNAILGLPNSMICTERTNQKVKAITIIYAPTVNCGWGTEEIVNAGLTALKIINSIELQGIRVKLVIEGMCATRGNDLSMFTVVVKDYKEAIDIKKICFPVAHGSMLRRIGFKWLETCPQVTNSGYTSGYGTPLSNNSYESVIATLKDNGLLKDNCYYINAPICRDNKYDPQKVMEAVGMKEVKYDNKDKRSA